MNKKYMDKMKRHLDEAEASIKPIEKEFDGAKKALFRYLENADYSHIADNIEFDARKIKYKRIMTIQDKIDKILEKDKKHIKYISFIVAIIVLSTIVLFIKKYGLI